MKIILYIILLSLAAISAFAQDNLIEKNFEKNKRSYSLFHYSEGEDASSGWDYLVYTKKKEIKKIRVISLSSNPSEMQDYYYENGKPVLFVDFGVIPKRLHKSLVKGSSVALKAKDRLHFTDSKLVSWVENGKAIPATDSRWNEQETYILRWFTDLVESYRINLDEKK